MKYLFVMLVLCVTSPAVCSVTSITLSEADQALLLAKIKQENVVRKYWPSDVEVALQGFCKIISPDGGDAKYSVRVRASYSYFLDVIFSSGSFGVRRVRCSKSIQGAFTQAELNALGITLPE